ncbi:gap junction delta-4 protein [Suncus etruscus]|uniref:gap junction delta-4 protein n=1 Tax=Suncus etruscus TaxID=109475 RepID=UPI002110A414|nr:gap junction delta-4 protein [Suncus etruscus]
MEQLDSLGFLIITLNCNVTIMGKIWLIFMILLRMVVITLAGSPVYHDEQDRFVCNTLQPGCANVCYDIFSPVSHLRFWLLQSVSTLLPSTVFIAYVLHQGAVLVACGPRGIATGTRDQGPSHLTSGDWCCPLTRVEHGLQTVPDFTWGYIAHLLLRILLEVTFGALHYLFFGFLVPERFSCKHSPCTGVVDCYVSRPTEKSILMLFMWTVSALSLLLSLLDLICSLQRRLSRRSALRAPPTRKAIIQDCWEGPTEVPAHPSSSWREAQGAESPSGKSAASGRMELPDELESEAMSLGSNKLAGPGKDGQCRPQGEAAQDGLQASAPRSRLVAQYSPSTQRPLPERSGSSLSAPHLRTRKSEWV